MYKTLSHWLKQQQTPMTEQLLAWSQINSGTFHLAGLNRMADALVEAFSPLNAKFDRIALSPYESIDDAGHTISKPLGSALSFVKWPDAPIQVLLCGHMDTVFGESSAFQTYQFIDDNTLNGPGVTDMKGGLLIMLYALQAVEQFADPGAIGWRVLINSDEEIGSPGSAPLFKTFAPSYHYGLVFEPALTPDGVFAGRRKGSGNFSLIVRGVSAHVGRAFDEGRNAIVALAHLMQALDALNGQREAVTINIGYCHGGGVLNSVPDLAIGKLNVRTFYLEDAAWFYQQLEQLIETISKQFNVQVEWQGGFGRPPKLMDEKHMAFYQRLAKVSNDMGLSASWQATGGCCDGNNLASLGLPTIDTLGARGGAIHTDKEFILLDSLAERAELTARLLIEIAQ
ncbi:MAG: hydrolase [Gammaproteobacteria bacterium]|nr:hydrolase [Gammaproteobacteria bacterium]